MREHPNQSDNMAADKTSAQSPIQLALMRFLLDVRRRGVTSHNVLSAYEKVWRPDYLPKSYAMLAYEDSILPISAGQIIESPYTIGYLLNTLHIEPMHRTLEVGTGTGFSSAMLSHMCRRVFTLERSRNLFEWSQRALQSNHIQNVSVHFADGTNGYPAQAPYDRILVTAHMEKIPEILTEQLANGGRMLVPIGSQKGRQMMWLITRENNQLHQKPLTSVRFAPLSKGTMRAL